MMLTTEMKETILAADKKPTDSAYMAWIDPFNKNGWNFSFHSNLAAAIDARWELLNYEHRIPALDHGCYGNLMDLV